MSAPEVTRIIDKIEELRTDVSTLTVRFDDLEKKVDKHNGLIDRMYALEGEHKLCVAALDSVKDHCKSVQMAKKEKRIKWEVIYPSVVSTVVAALVIYLLIGS